ncbi:hypothetical protein niasHT_022469 [Heterodera trifolii]|uniref:BTB domain-containing protein n=1 Tax=Heterodera trifolii TaxID=157864 RepID=A0ABD2JGX3_9BILA
MPGRPFAKKKLREIFKLDEIKTRTEFVDAGEMEVTISYPEIPESSVCTYKSATYKFGCLPWHIELHRHFRCGTGILGNGRPKQVIKDTDDWTAKATGTVTMKKWPDKLPKCSGSQQHLDELKEHFSRKFTNSQPKMMITKDFPLPPPVDGGSARVLPPSTGAAADAQAYVSAKSKRVKFRLEFILHNVRKSFFPILDFGKPSASSNAIVKVGNDGKHKFYVNKELLSMFSEGFERMFNSEGFREQRTQEVELKTVSPDVFREFLYIIYPSHKRPHVPNTRGLLELARMYFIPTVTAMCEQCLLQATETDMVVGERLKLADEYGLLRLKANIMQKTDPNALRDIQGLREDTLGMLVRKLQNRDKLQREKEKRMQQTRKDDGGEAMEVDGKQGTSTGHGAAAASSARASNRGHHRSRMEQQRHHHH